MFSRSMLTRLERNVRHQGHKLHFNFRSLQAAHFSSKEPEKDQKSLGFFDKFLGKDTNIAPPTFDKRWLMVAPAFFTHMCIGSPFGWSVMADQLTREFGVVASSSGDWTLMSAAMPLSLVFAANGLSAALMGKWQMKVGPRKALAVAGCCFGNFVLHNLIDSLPPTIRSSPVINN